MAPVTDTVTDPRLEKIIHDRTEKIKPVRVVLADLVKPLARTRRLRLVPIMNKKVLKSRLAAFEVLRTVLHQKRALDEALESTAQLSELEPRERAFARNLIMTTLRRLGQINDLISGALDKPLGKKAKTSELLLQMGACQLLFMETADHAVISTAVDLAQVLDQGAYKKLINAILRRLQREGAARLDQQDAGKLNTADWLWESWERAYGGRKTRLIANAHMSEPPLDITPRSDPALWAERLEGKVLPFGTVRRQKGGNITDLPGFDEGAWWVQDAAAHLAASLLGDVGGKRVIDLCAAPGGKTLYLANAGANVTAVDRSQNRLNRLRENLDRMKLDAEVVTADAVVWRPEAPADMVLLDAPCSATGTIRRHPDIQILKSADDVQKLANLQSRLLDAAVEMMAPDGTLLFCTCSLQPEEGPVQIERFLERHPAFRLDPITPDEVFETGPEATNDGMFRSLPGDIADLGGRDGFFAARLVRR